MEFSLIPYPNILIPRNNAFNAENSFSSDTVEKIHDDSLRGEHYRLEVTSDNVKLYAGTDEGFYRGKTTLSQLLCCSKGKIPCVMIDDEPQFSYRGFHIDSARHMQSVDELKRMIDAASLFKFNFFHWHLSDDQGFRIESERFPLLNEKGSFRDSSDFGKVHINERYGGFYTKSEIRHIVEYCAQRFIQVIPEIEMPGHTSAILHTFPHLSCSGISPNVKTTAGIFKDVLCCGKKETLSFILELIDEVSELFPCRYFHVGGDETPKLRWNNCPVCGEKMKTEGLENAEQLQLWFTNRITEHLEKLGKTAICWNETLKGGNPDNAAIIQNWMDKDKLCPKYAENGGKLIMSDFYHYYCDYPYAMTPLKKTYNYSPHKGLSSYGKRNILGVEAALWTEFISDFRRLSFLAYPRFAAVAETGWTKSELKNYKSFQSRFIELRPQLFEIGVIPAAQCEWNPNPLRRLTGTIGFFSGNINKETVKDFFFKKD